MLLELLTIDRSIDIGGDKKLNVTTKGNDENGNTNIHVQRLRANGKDWKKSRLTWDDIFTDGGSLEELMTEIHAHLLIHGTGRTHF